MISLQSHAAAAEKSLDDGERAPSHVLVVEDDPAAAELLRTLLTRVGYTVTVMYDGTEALRTLEEDALPDVLLLDWMLPDVSGLEICRTVRERWDKTQLPIIMVTAKTDVDSISSAFGAGATDYISKPFSGAELRARVTSHLKTKQLMDERRRLDDHLVERDKLSSLGLLVSGVAHDLNNPLAAIYGYAQLLLEDEVDITKSEGLRQILSDVQRCRRIIKDLLDFARRQPPVREYVDLSPLLQGTISLRRRQVESAGISLRLHIEPGLPRLHGNANQLQQVFLNILLNAEHALRMRGSEVRITAGVLRFSAPFGPGGDWIAIRFYNDGPPIAPNVQPRIFNPFFTTKTKEEGTGLGLSICRRIVREHGGEIQVESGEEGTTFSVLLPMTNPALNEPSTSGE